MKHQYHNSNMNLPPFSTADRLNQMEATRKFSWEVDEIWRSIIKCSNTTLALLYALPRCILTGRTSLQFILDQGELFFYVTRQFFSPLGRGTPRGNPTWDCTDNPILDLTEETTEAKTWTWLVTETIRSHFNFLFTRVFDTASNWLMIKTRKRFKISLLWFVKS